MIAFYHWSYNIIGSTARPSQNAVRTGKIKWKLAKYNLRKTRRHFCSTRWDRHTNKETLYHYTDPVEYYARMSITHTTTQLHLFNGLFSRTTRVSQYQKGKTSPDLNEARDDGGWDAVASAGPCAPRSRQTTTPTPHHSFFAGRMLFLSDVQLTMSEHWKQ